MKLCVLILLLPGVMLMSTTEEYNVTDSSNATDYPYGFTEDITEEIEKTEAQHQDTSKLRVYKGPLPKFPGTTTSPWIALHSPVRMYIPIRNTGTNSAESLDCVQCPKNLIVYLPPHQIHILTPIPTISICSSFARRSGRVHVAVVSGPRPGERLYAGRYQVELMVWKADGPVHSCNYNITIKGKRQVSANTRKIPCPKPDKPSNGILLCDPKGRKHYAHNSVCQIYCMTSYLIENSTSNSSTVICKNGRWSPENHVSCVAAFCPDLRKKSPSNGYWDCDEDGIDVGFKNGTHCEISCQPGFVIPSSQLENSTIVCRPPSWNYSNTLPQCKRAQTPKLQMCHNRHLIVRTGQAVKISPQLLPKGQNHAGVTLRPECSLQGKNLPKGKHQNVCEVTDLELRTKRKCTYRIHIEESSGPEPHAGDCKNRTVFANRKGIIHSKPVRFLVKVGEPARTRILHGNCKPKGNLKVGTHSVFCKATNPYTKVTGTCSYWLKVQGKSCPVLPEIPNARLVCDSRSVGAVCHYECNEGYAVHVNYLSGTTKSCHSSLKWQPAVDPVCEMKPPELVEGCENVDVQLPSDGDFTIPLPKYLTALNETLNVTCTPSFINVVGYHHVLCNVEDDRFNASCHFNVTASMENELTTMTEMPTTGDRRLQLLEGCDDLEVNMSLPFNFTVPIPRFVTAMNETPSIYCSPSSIFAPGLHSVMCVVEDDSSDASCYFNVTIFVRDEQTTIFYPENELELDKSCENMRVNVSSPIRFVVPQPQFLTLNRTILNVTCTPYIITVEGKHPVTCVVDDGIYNDSCHFDVTVQTEDQQSSEISPEKSSCQPLSAPLHGSVQCTVTPGETEFCQVTCDPGYGFSEDNFLSVVCVGSIWDFQESDVNGTLPDCFAQMEGSAVEVWISFEAFAPHCEKELEEQMENLVNEFCQIGTNCSKVNINCTLDEESDMILMTVNWTVEADFNDEEYYDGEEIPEAEIRLESVMEKTRTFLATEDVPGGVHLFRDSFRRGLITLVCPDGFVPNGLMSKCIQCPKGVEHC